MLDRYPLGGLQCQQALVNFGGVLQNIAFEPHGTAAMTVGSENIRNRIHVQETTFRWVTLFPSHREFCPSQSIITLCPTPKLEVLRINYVPLSKTAS